MPRTSTGEDVIVLETFLEPSAGTNPYMTQLARNMPDGVRILTFGWRRALLGRYDVLHIHFPELLLRGSTRPRTYAHRLLAVVLLLRCWLRRTAVVQTLHNHRPHEDRGPVERVLLRAIRARTDWWILINTVDAAPRPGRATTILHGHYRDWFAGCPRPPRSPGRLAYVGMIREYKNVPALLAVFSQVDDDSLSLVVAGQPRTDDLTSALSRAAARDGRVRLDLAYVDDDTLARTVSEAELVVLPYTEMRNSGAALLALSLDRPVLVPRGTENDALAAEVGEDWVLRYDGPLTREVITAAVDVVRGPRAADRPMLDGRDWKTAGHLHREAFRAALTRRRHRREDSTTR
ncbi:glycosyl transferase [Mumia sp. zg.B17]|uniref:glycosyl transferase n=1 Tax=Mumia sp. zg.B17 TaxID=2855446 RepID=UPI001C6DF670|nr:glycosyl transferase [Mumia sp. zg.B17]MBW9206902.1 glycosyl transferase [Mumia sp. zg.B17]